MELKEIISNNLSWWIKKREYPTIEKFAHENEFTKQTVNNVINQTYMPKIDYIVKFAKALEITPDSLLLEPKKKPDKWGEIYFISNRNRHKFK